MQYMNRIKFMNDKLNGKLTGTHQHVTRNVVPLGGNSSSLVNQGSVANIHAGSRHAHHDAS